MHNVVPIDTASLAPQREKRLVLRVLDVWRQARHDDQLPLVSALTVSDTGADADHVYTIDVLNPGGPCFTYIGEALRVPGWPPSPQALVADCPQVSVLGLTSRHWQEIVTRGVPVTRGGVGFNAGVSVLYRSIMVPLANESGKIAVIMGAANWRLVEEQDGTPVE